MDFRQNVYDTGVVAICRRVYGEELMKLSDALYEGGVRLMEVTFDQSDPDCLNRTGQAISQLISRHGDMSFGAGTVLTESQLRAAKAAGGQFVVSPNTNPVLIRLTKELGMGSIPGAMIGGLLLGIIEILGKAYISTELGDAIVFAVLIIVLLFKPAGLLGKPIHEKV